MVLVLVCLAGCGDTDERPKIAVAILYPDRYSSERESKNVVYPSNDPVITQAMKARFPDNSPKASFEAFMKLLGGKCSGGGIIFRGDKPDILGFGEKDCYIVEESSMCADDVIDVRVNVLDNTISIIDAAHTGVPKCISL